MDIIKKQLMDYADPKYREFTIALLPGVNNLLGVRMPILKKMAKEFAKDEMGQLFLQEPSPETFEELMLQGLIIGNLQVDIDDLLMYVDEFVNKINNWSICDSFCANLRRQVKEHQERFWEFIQPYMLRRFEFEARFGLVMANNFFVDDKHIYELLEQLKKAQNNAYYAQMAFAWLISTCYVKFPEVTFEFLGNVEINNQVKNKIVRKVLDSFRVKEDNKQKLKDWAHNIV